MVKTSMVIIFAMVLVGSCLTAQTAFATNESSYKIGYANAVDEYSGCDDSDEPTCHGNDGAIYSYYKGETSDYAKTSE